MDELLEQLRSQGYSDLTAVKYAVLETSGQVSEGSQWGRRR